MAIKTSSRNAGKADVELGRKLRALRNERRISQMALGDKLSISFQQVQKYEKGLNRVSSARLQQIAKIFDVPLQQFYAVNGHEGDSESLLRGNDAGTIQMLRLYSRIKNQETQHRLVALIESIADQYA